MRGRRGTLGELIVNKSQPALKEKNMPDSLTPKENLVKDRVQLVHAVGMHARPAVKLTKLAKRFKSRIAVRVAGAGSWIDAKSVAKVMTMRAACDSIIEFEAS